MRRASRRKSSTADPIETVRSPGPELSGTNLAHAGDHNQRVTLHAVRVNGPVTRSELAMKTGLTPAAIANITNRLLSDRLILRAGRLRGARGQPAIKFVINPDSCFSIGLNVDRDHVTLVALDFVGKVRARASREIHFAKPAAVRIFFQKSVGQLLLKAGIARTRLIGVGVAFPDDITRAHLPDQPPDYAAWASVRVDDLIRDVLGIPVFIENDAAAAAIGEMQFGSGHRYRSFFYLLVTAALGGGLVADGSYFRGANGRSGEIGWLRSPSGSDDSRQLQNIVSLSCLYSRLAEQGIRVATPPGLMQMGASGRLIVDRWIHESTEALVESFIAINCLINPEAILIGGRLPAALVDRLAASLNKRMAAFAGQLPAIAPVARALTSDDAPAVGAAILPFSYRLLPTRFALLKTT
ncbi:MAG TPA: ROK family transcriptional regulator [Steroidobacteraceae bacterium]|jgi:predicted NBD/HSP70 family sugar kinase|nr:ROK family transcriptional regulator [Steroidobacteraceae bacterium]